MDRNNTIKEMYVKNGPMRNVNSMERRTSLIWNCLLFYYAPGRRGKIRFSLRSGYSPGFCAGGDSKHPSMVNGAVLQIRGIGKVKAIQILCLSELAKRLSKAEAQSGLNFSAPETIAQYYMEDMRHRKKEALKLLLLNMKTKLIGESELSLGTINTTLVSPREVFAEALRRNAAAVILLHNHPSGDPTPSREDVLATRRVIDAGKIIGSSFWTTSS